MSPLEQRIWDQVAALDARVAGMSDDELVAWLAGTEAHTLAPSGVVLFEALERLWDMGVLRDRAFLTDRVSVAWARARDACRDHLLKTP